MSIAETGSRSLHSKIVVTSFRLPGLAGCCWGWRGAHDGAHRARVKIGGRNQQVRRLFLEAAGEPLNPTDEAICFCSHAWCVNPRHLAHGSTKERHAFGRHGSIDLGTLWVARRLLSDLAITLEELSGQLGISSRLLRDAVDRVQ